ncbi:TPR repeat-containing protein [Chondrus crispus]|uniref:TPR repeat-containing protein n=1 Tax=Chondrus crispus TaxID=2769 RepID=R7QHF3_CHOCR|nr:TPR repeat-containing protein [Chondrus crispus]CDF36896.1 TPR repeat-containing protein [Chondrus crispus]|eukprot:XP_005716715.1 TPR repeat-containing protein [Chondrus crispus]
MYALYLAGEKRKEEERQELADWTEPVNMELAALRQEFLSLRVKGKLDAHLWYLFAVVLKQMRLAKQAVYAFEQSLSLFPYNWGAWLELAPLCESADVVMELDVKQEWLKALFLAHYYNEMDEAEAARQIYENVLDVVPHSAFVKGQLALALYNVRRFDEAQQLYDDIYTEDPHCLDGIDIYSNILYVKEDKVQLSLLANRCIKIDKFRLETCCVIGNYYSLRGQHDQAVVYFQRALKLNRNYLSAWTLMGHEFLEMKNASAAVEAYRRAVDINPKDFRAWYGLGQTYELLSLPLFTLYYYQRAAALRPKDVRMWCAIGQTYEELSKQDDAIRCYERARRCDDQDSLALAKLAYLYEKMAREALKDGRQQELGVFYSEQAAQYHLANLTRRDQETLTGPETVDALKFLAEHYYARQMLSHAEKYCHRLMDYAGRDKDFAKKMLRQIHKKDEE